MNKFFKFNEFVELGNIFMNSEAYLIALEYFNLAIDLSYFPINKVQLAEAYDLRGKTKKFLGRYVESIIDFSKAIELDPKDSYLYFSRGMSYEYLKLNEEALKNFQIALKLDPDNFLALSIIEHLKNENN